MSDLILDNGAKNSNALSVKIFENPEFGRVRTCLIEDAPWFVGKDVAEILGYKNTNKAIIDHIDEEDKKMVKLADIQDPNETLPPHMEGSVVILINESGLYSLILRSNMEGAKAFKRWVTNEVLPSIRRIGSYSLKKETVEKEEMDERESALFTVQFVEALGKALNLDNTDKVMLLKKALPESGIPMKFMPLPDYLPSQGVHKSASALLEEINADMDARQFNALMEERGFLKKVFRKSSKTPNKTKWFWNLVGKGLDYGINLVSPNNRNETQPHYFADKFGELLSILEE